MLTPQIVAPRGVYESCFYLFSVGTLALFSVTGHGIMHQRRVVRTAEEYTTAMIALSAALDEHDPPPSLTLVE